MTKAMLIALIHSVAQQHGLDPKLMVAIAQQESSLRPNAVSQSGDIGLFQMSPRTAKAYNCSIAHLTIPLHNTECAARYLADLKKKWAHKEPKIWYSRFHHGRSLTLRFKYNMAVNTWRSYGSH